MDSLDDAEQRIRDAGGDLLRAAAALVAAQRRVSGLRKIIEGYAEMHPELRELADEALAETPDELEIPTAAAADRPKGAEAVHLILQENAGDRMRVSDLVGILREREWLPPDSSNPASAVRAALERLVTNSDESDVFKVSLGGQVFYMYDPDRDRTTPAKSGGGYGFDEEPF